MTENRPPTTDEAIRMLADCLDMLLAFVPPYLIDQVTPEGRAKVTRFAEWRKGGSWIYEEHHGATAWRQRNE